MITHRQFTGYRPNRANEDRARSAARRQAAAARSALAVLAAHDVELELSSTPVWRRQWIEVLRRRAADDVSTLSGLAATMTPPMTKDAFAGQLRRACRFADALATDTPIRGTDTSDDAMPSALNSPDLCDSAIEDRSCAEEFTVDPSAPAAGMVW
jgi:hypothetical protein